MVLYISHFMYSTVQYITAEWTTINDVTPFVSAHTPRAMTASSII
jgi:hypothetical protein